MIETAHDRTPSRSVTVTATACKPLATVKPIPGKGNLEGRVRPNLKPSPKTQELDRGFLRWVGAHKGYTICIVGDA